MRSQPTVRGGDARGARTRRSPACRTREAEASTARSATVACCSTRAATPTVSRSYLSTPTGIRVDLLVDRGVEAIQSLRQVLATIVQSCLRCVPPPPRERTPPGRLGAELGELLVKLLVGQLAAVGHAP